MEPRLPALGAWSLSYWITKEAPLLLSEHTQVSTFRTLGRHHSSICFSCPKFVLEPVICYLLLLGLSGSAAFRNELPFQCAFQEAEINASFQHNPKLYLPTVIPQTLGEQLAHAGPLGYKDEQESSLGPQTLRSGGAARICTRSTDATSSLLEKVAP